MSENPLEGAPKAGAFDREHLLKQLGSDLAPRADFTNIPIPPAGAEGEPAPAAPAEADPPLVAALEFLDAGAVRAAHDFSHPFRLDGREVRGFVARRLTLAEVGRIVVRAKAEGTIDPMEFYAVMTGLPAPVIRGLDADDGERLVEACYPFLPRVATAAISLLTSETGDGSA